MTSVWVSAASATVSLVSLLFTIYTTRIQGRGRPSIFTECTPTGFEITVKNYNSYTIRVISVRFASAESWPISGRQLPCFLKPAEMAVVCLDVGDGASRRRAVEVETQSGRVSRYGEPKSIVTVVRVGSQAQSKNAGCRGSALSLSPHAGP